MRSRSWVEDYHARADARNQTATDGGGRHRIDSLADGTNELSASCDGYELQARSPPT